MPQPSDTGTQQALTAMPGLALDMESVQIDLHIPSCSKAGAHGHAKRHGVQIVALLRQSSPQAGIPESPCGSFGIS